MASKSKKSSNRKVKVNKLSKKALGKGDMKKVKGGTGNISLNYGKIEYKY